MATATPVLSESERREAWLAARRQHVTGTDIAGLLGLEDAYASLSDIVLEKRELIARDSKVPEYLEAGIRFQDANLRWYADKTGEAIEMCDPYSLVECPSLPILAVSLDGRRATGDRRPIDAKNIGYRDDEWGEPGSDEVPPRFAAQLTAQMLCCQTQIVDLSVVFGGRKHEIYTVRLDSKVAEFILDAASDFHRRYIAGDEMPKVDGSESWTNLMKRRGSKDQDLAPATPSLLDLAVRYRALKENEKAVEADIASVGNQLRAAIGDHAGLDLGTLGRLWYKSQAPGEVVNSEGYASALEEQLVRFDPTWRERFPALKKSYTTTKPGNRPLMPKWKKES